MHLKDTIEGFMTSPHEKLKAEIFSRQGLEGVYAEVAEEIALGDLSSGLWAKARVDANQDEDKAKSAYFNLRVQAKLDDIALIAVAAEQLEQEEKRAKKSRAFAQLAMQLAIIFGFCAFMATVALIQSY